MDVSAQYICESCGEEVEVSIDYSAGLNQQYVEDCPVCCNPNMITVTLELDGGVQITGQPIQDHS